MGIPCIEAIQDCGWEPADTIALLSLIMSAAGIFVNAGVAWWIVKTVQTGLSNQRVLKDHLIREVITVRDQYETFFGNLFAGKIDSRTIIPRFKRMNIRVNSLLSFIRQKYNIDSAKLRPYQVTLPDMITNDRGFEVAFAKNALLDFKGHTLRELHQFQSDNSHLFNDIIIWINDAK